MIIDFNRYNGGGGSGSGVTPAEVQQQINSALTPYWDSAETQSAITAVEDHLFDVEQVTASALTELHDGLLEVSARTVDMSDYWTSAQTEEAISAATSGKADKANVSPNYGALKFPAWNADGIIVETVSAAHASSNFYLNGTKREPIFSNRADAQARIDIYTPLSAGTAGDILVSTGNGAPVWTTDNKVSSTSVSTIWKGTQAEYDAIATKDPSTFYIIL